MSSSKSWAWPLLIVLAAMSGVSEEAKAAGDEECIGVFVADRSGTATHVRNAPAGQSVAQLPVGSEYTVEVCQVSRGWWRIQKGSVIMAYGSEYEGEMPLPPSNSYWMHYSVLALSSRNYNREALRLYASPSTRSHTVYRFEGEILLRPLGWQGDWVQVETEDRKHRGWIQGEWLCSNPLTNCS